MFQMKKEGLFRPGQGGLPPTAGARVYPGPVGGRQRPFRPDSPPGQAGRAGQPAGRVGGHDGHVPLLFALGGELPEGPVPGRGWSVRTPPSPRRLDKWTIPGFEYRVVEQGPGAFAQALAALAEEGLPLAGAVQELTLPAAGKEYLCFPVGSFCNFVILWEEWLWHSIKRATPLSTSTIRKPCASSPGGRTACGCGPAKWPPCPSGTGP